MIGSERGRRLALFVLALLLAALVLRLGAHVLDFGRRSLQMDFAAFHAAGRAARAGLSPYANHIEREPPIWDGVDTYRHSRFLYPPPAAHAFRPLAALPYHRAKTLWMLLCLGGLGGALWIAGREAGLARAGARSAQAWLALGILAAAYYPLLALLERGQIDSITLLLLLGTMTGSRAASGRAFAAGGLLACACWLKLHCVFLVPLLVLERRWRALAGFAGAASAIVALSLVVDGPQRMLDYLRVDLPRIARYGERGTKEMLLPPEVVRPIHEALALGRTTLDHRTYDVEGLPFVLNASLVRTPLGRSIWSGLRELGWPIAPGHVSLVFFVAACLVVLPLVRGGRADGFALLDWQIALLLVLLCAPATWAMNTVWLLPTGAVVLGVLVRGSHTTRRTWIATCAAGLLLACVPYRLGRAVVPGAWLDLQYIAAELLCLAGLLGLRAGRVNEPSAPTPRPGRS